MKHDHPELVFLAVAAVAIALVFSGIADCGIQDRISDLESALTPVAEEER